MDTDLQVVDSSSLVTSLKASHDLVAVNATEMAASRNSLQLWLRKKLEAVHNDLMFAKTNYDEAVKHKWKSSPFKAQIRKEERKQLYYEKILAAAEAGFTIIPNMDVTVFAVRTKRARPKWNGNEGTSTYGYRHASPNVPDEEEQRLPVGDGEYQSPNQVFRENHQKLQQVKDGKMVEVYHVRQICEGFDQVEFPLAVAHPLVMNATAQAMARKIFDRIAIVPQHFKRRGDPIVVGQITRKEGYSVKTASFLIAWYLDPETL